MMRFNDVWHTHTTMMITFELSVCILIYMIGQSDDFDDSTNVHSGGNRLLVK